MARPKSARQNENAPEDGKLLKVTNHTDKNIRTMVRWESCLLMLLLLIKKKQENQSKNFPSEKITFWNMKNTRVNYGA